MSGNGYKIRLLLTQLGIPFERKSRWGRLFRPRIHPDPLPSIVALGLVLARAKADERCGGAHVRDTSEVGTVSIYRTENKGKINKRLYVRLGDVVTAV